MATPKFICGAECGVNAIGTLLPAGTLRHWSTFGASVTNVLSTDPTNAPDMPGARTYKFAPVAATTDTLAHTFATTIASPATMVVRFKLRFQTLPNAMHTICSEPNGLAGVRYNPTGTKLECWAGAATTSLGGTFVPVVDTIYLIELRFVRDANPSSTLYINGVQQGFASKAGTATTIAGITFGHNATGQGGSVACTAVYYIDDIIVSGTSTDFLIGDGTVVGLYPNTDGIHAFNTNDFAWPTAAGTKPSTATDAWTSLKAPTGGGADGQGLNSAIGEFISQVVINTGGYVEIGFDPMPAASSINGIGLISEHHGSTTGVHTQSLYIAASHSAAWSDAALLNVSEASLTVCYNSKNYPTVPTVGGAWTKAILDAVVVWWGQSSDVIGNPILDGVCIEVDYIPDAGQSTTLTDVDFILTPVALTTSVGDTTTSISPVVFTLTPVGLTGQITAFSPISLSGLVGWWDASDLATITDAGAGAVSQWTDKSGNVRTFTQASAGSRPITGTRTVNGMNALDFNGTTHNLQSPSFVQAQPVSIFVVAAFDGPTDGTQRTIVGCLPSSATYVLQKLAANTWEMYAGNGVGGGAVTAGTHKITELINGASSVLRIDGAQVGSGNAGTTAQSPTTPLVVGYFKTGTTGSFDGPLCEVVYFNRVLTAPEIAQMETYLGRWFPPSATVTPVVITFSPVTLTATPGTSSRTLTSVVINVTPQPLITSIGGVSTTLGVITVTLTPVALTVSVGTTSRTLGVVTVTFTPVALVASVGTVSRILGVVTITLTPVALTTSVGNTTASISPVVFSLTPVVLTGQGIASQVSSIAPVIITLNPQSLTPSVGTASRTLGVITVIFTPVVLTASVGTASRTLGVVTVTFTPVALGKSVGGVTSSILPVLITFNPQSLSISVGTALRTLGPITVTLIPVALTILGTTTTTLSPVTFTLTIPTLTYSVGTSTRIVSPVLLIFTAVGLTKSIGGVSTSLGTVIFTLNPVQIVPSVGNSSRAINPINLTLTIVALNTVSIIGGKPKVWTGTEWVEKPVKVWMDGVWVEKPMKVWTGSEWELV
jgi:hypothetical protein